MLVSKKHDKMKEQRYRLSTLLLVIGLLLPFGALADFQNTQSSSSASGSYQVPAYERKPGVAGKISSVGSDTLANLMTF
ncbi:MAG: phosphate ABC transporter substrate-binding protein, partial [Pseudomonadota bacterium]|nr:phosphate ABC transporter substrate-binding protein [Pseudomonadota bacterium]